MKGCKQLHRQFKYSLEGSYHEETFYEPGNDTSCFNITDT